MEKQLLSVLNAQKKSKDLSTLNVNSIPNFSWTPPLFFQVLGTVHIKVKEIMV